MPRKRKRKDIPKHMLPENRDWDVFDLPEVDEDEEAPAIDWRELGAECTQRRNGRPLIYYMESWEEQEES